MLPEPTRLLTHLREQIDLMLVGCPDLENLVRFIARHVEKLEIPYHPAALRAFYLSLFYNRQLDLAIALDMFLGSSLPSELAIDLTLIRLLATAEEIIQDFSLKAMLNLFLALDMPSSFSIAPDFALEIHQQKELLPNPRMGKEKLKIWWQDQGQSWVDRLRKLIFFYRYSGYAMPSNASLPEIIEAYLQANQFILDCASHAPGIEPQWLNSLKENLLLPPRE